MPSVRSSFPIRWRIALLIASLTSVVLIAFAVVIAATTEARLRADFEQTVDDTSRYLAGRIKVEYVRSDEGDQRLDSIDFSARTFAQGSGGVIRVVAAGQVLENTRRGVSLGAARTGRRRVGDLLVDTRPLTSGGGQIGSVPVYVQYGRSVDDLEATIARIRLLLALATLVGSALSLAAASWIGGRALRPVRELTDTATGIAQTGDSAKRLPIPGRRDELRALALTLDAMLESLDAARSTTERTLENQRDFLADASHELRTPLTSVITNLEMLEADSHDAEQRETAAAALRSARRMRGLVADLLALARAEAPASAPTDRVDLATIVGDAVAEVEDLLADHELTVETAPTIVLGRRDDLHRVVRNLLENAARHTPPGTSVTVEVGVRGGHASLAVEDDGPGLADGVRGRAFERFVRSGSRSGPSSGLGLSIVRATAQAHGGWVELRSPARAGHGTRVELRLPLAAAAD